MNAKIILAAVVLLAAGAARAEAATPLTVMLTFDDGVKGHLQYAAPMLEKFGWRATSAIRTRTPAPESTR